MESIIESTIEFLVHALKVTLWIAVGLFIVPCIFIAQRSESWIDWGKEL